MEELDTLIKIGSAIAALALICKAIKEVYKFIKAIYHLADDIKEIKEHSTENYLTCLRLTVMSHDMPIGERIIAGDKYIKAGGNGEVKKYIETELHTNEIQHD